MRAADHLVDLGPGAGEHGGRIVAAGHGGGGRARSPESLTGQFLPGTRDDRGAGEAAHADRLPRDRGARRSTTSSDIDVKRAARRADVRDRRLGLGQVDARQRDPLQGGRQPPAPRAAAAGRAPAVRGPRPARQDHRSRPVADRAHAALEPGDVHGPVRRHPRPVLQDAGGAGARLQAGPLLVQRQGRALRGLPRRRPDQDRDALPARRLRAVRAVPRQALQPRDARRPLQGQEHRRRARHAGRGGAGVLRSTSRRSAGGWRRSTPSGSATSGSASRRRRCRAARRSASSSRPSCRRSRPGGRCTSSTSRRRACTSPTSSGCWRSCTGSSTQGNSVVVIEHNLDVIKTADRIIDMGPEGGEEGGTLVAPGTPEEVAGTPGSHTGGFLAELVTPARPARDGAGAKRAARREGRRSRDDRGRRAAQALRAAGARGGGGHQLRGAARRGVRASWARTARARPRRSAR